MVFDVNFPQLVRDLTLNRLRKPRHLAWLESLIKPSVNLLQDFKSFVLGSRLELKYNSVTIVLEFALNNVFDPGLRRIYILNNPERPPWLFEFARSENEPDNMEFSTADNQPWEYEQNSYEHLVSIGFVVHVPAELAPDEIAIRTMIERLKFPSITYQITYF